MTLRPEGPCEAASRSEGTTPAPRAEVRPYRTMCEKPAARLLPVTVPRTQASTGQRQPSGRAPPGRQGQSPPELPTEPRAGNRRGAREAPPPEQGPWRPPAAPWARTGTLRGGGVLRRRTQPPSPGSATGPQPAVTRHPPTAPPRARPPAPRQRPARELAPPPPVSGRASAGRR